MNILIGAVALYIIVRLLLQALSMAFKLVMLLLVILFWCTLHAGGV